MHFFFLKSWINLYIIRFLNRCTDRRLLQSGDLHQSYQSRESFRDVTSWRRAKYAMTAPLACRSRRQTWPQRTRGQSIGDEVKAKRWRRQQPEARATGHEKCGDDHHSSPSSSLLPSLLPAFPPESVVDRSPRCRWNNDMIFFRGPFLHRPIGRLDPRNAGRPMSGLEREATLVGRPPERQREKPIMSTCRSPMSRAPRHARLRWKNRRNAGRPMLDWWSYMFNSLQGFSWFS